MSSQFEPPPPAAADEERDTVDDEPTPFKSWCTCGAGEYQPPEVHADSCPGSMAGLARAESDAAPREAIELGAEYERAREEEGAMPRFTVGEKIASVVSQVFNSPPPTPAAAAVVRAVRNAHRFGFTRPLLGLFPPLEDEEAWTEMLAIFVGVALELQSDGSEVDVKAAREAGAFVLANLFAG